MTLDTWHQTFTIYSVTLKYLPARGRWRGFGLMKSEGHAVTGKSETKVMVSDIHMLSCQITLQ